MQLRRCSLRVSKSAMSEDSERHGEPASEGGGPAKAVRVLLTSSQIDAASVDSLRSTWRAQDLYIDHLETLNKQLEGIYESPIGLVAPLPAFDSRVTITIDNALTKLVNTVIKMLVTVILKC